VSLRVTFHRACAASSAGVLNLSLCRISYELVETLKQQLAEENYAASALEAQLRDEISRNAAVLSRFQAEMQKELSLAAQDMSSQRSRADAAERSLELLRQEQGEEASLMAAALHAVGKDLVRAQYHEHARSRALISAEHSVLRPPSETIGDQLLLTHLRRFRT
jgi:hypothetical protein